jgi:topoisomerase (DNA) II binding protein 1
VHGAGVTHAILSKTGPPGCADHDVSCAATRVGSRVVTWFWIEQCLKSNALVSVDDSALFKPPPSLDGLPEFRDVKVCVTGYTGDRRNELITIVGLLGGEYMRSLDRRSTHLVCYDFQGAKWAKANETKIQKVVSHRWLEECLTKYAKVRLTVFHQIPPTVCLYKTDTFFCNHKLGELPFSTRSGKDEDAAALAALEDPEIPDSDDETTETETNVIEDSLVTEPAEPVGNATGKRRDASLCVTELTDGAREAANAKSSKTPPATVLRDISSTQTQPLDDPPGTGGMEPPAPHGPTQDAVTEKQSPVHGSDLLSPDWSALELRQSQHVERSKRNETLDPRLAEVLRRGEKPSREQQVRIARFTKS